MARACILSVSGPVLTPAETELFSAVQPWGVILMGRSCVTPEQVRRLVGTIWDALGRDCLIFIDQEGGRVARLKAPQWPVFPAAKAYADLYALDPDAGRQAAWLGFRLIAAELSALGIHANCAPVLDLPAAGAHDVIGDRAFGTRPDAAGDLAKAALLGMKAGGVAGVIKHIPGHGRSMADTHAELPRVTASELELETDFDVFARLADAPMAMTAHISYEALDPGVAATVSKTVIGQIIRGRIGFDGLLMTDDLGMNALGGSLSERGRAAIAAGCDVLLHCSGFLKDPNAILAEMAEVAECAPVLSGRSRERAEDAEAWSNLAEDFDLAEGWQRFTDMFPQLKGVA